jgi:predicted unusual protein kinase regulating ubiquinone biosynthesis (AarF/ABC1/UbiB family)
LQDRCRAVPDGEEAERIIEEELGVRISKLFDTFDPDTDRSRIARAGPPRHAA